MTKEEYKEWERRGKDTVCMISGSLMAGTIEDFVQWNRAEAEMIRWREQYEIKHTEFHRSIKYCRTFSNIWDKLAKEAKEGVSSDEPAEALGKAAYGRWSAALWDEMEQCMRAAFKKVGLPEFVDIPAGKKLHDQVCAWQQSEMEALFSPFYQ
jgi:hypothetical protein